MDPEEGPGQVVSDFVLVQSELGERAWLLESERAVYGDGDSVVVLSVVDLTFFEEDIPTTVLTGDSGRVELGSGLLRIWGDVQAETNDDRHMETEEIIWIDSLGIMHSDCLVVLTVPDSVGWTVLSGRDVDLDTGLDAAEGVDIEEDFTAVRTGELEID